MKHKRVFVHFIITLMFTLSIVAQAAPPTDETGQLQQRVAELEATVTALQAKLACVSDISTSTELVFSDCNVRVVNGTGSTNSINGRGNLIVGYDTARVNGSNKTGSHNVVIGDEHNYRGFGGFVAGFGNAINGDWASVSGGKYNTARGDFSSISGGENNEAYGDLSSVSGGAVNSARGDFSSVSGGLQNEAYGDLSSVSGGTGNLARGRMSSISGGAGNKAIGFGSSVSGGNINEAIGIQSSILGGNSESTSTTDDTIPALP